MAAEVFAAFSFIFSSFYFLKASAFYCFSSVFLFCSSIFIACFVSLSMWTLFYFGAKFCCLIYSALNCLSAIWRFLSSYVYAADSYYSFAIFNTLALCCLTLSCFEVRADPAPIIEGLASCEIPKGFYSSACKILFSSRYSSYKCLAEPLFCFWFAPRFFSWGIFFWAFFLYVSGSNRATDSVSPKSALVVTVLIECIEFLAELTLL